MEVGVGNQLAFKSFAHIEQIQGNLLAAESQGVGQVDVVGDVVDVVEGKVFMVGAFVFFHLFVVGLGNRAGDGCGYTY